MRSSLLLDMDGTVSDTIEILFQAYSGFLLERGCQPDRSEFDALNGVPLNKVIELLKKKHELRGDVGELYRTYSLRLQEASYLAQPSEGVFEFLSWAKNKGYAVALVTSATKEYATTWLSRTELVDFFDAIVGGDMVAHGKPEPEPYLTAMKMLNSSREVAFAVEDSKIGVTSALAAGIKTFVLAKEAPIWLSDPKFKGAQCVHSFSEIRDLLSCP